MNINTYHGQNHSAARAFNASPIKSVPTVTVVADERSAAPVFTPFDRRQDDGTTQNPPVFSSSSSSQIFYEVPKRRARETEPRKKRIQWEQFENEVIIQMVNEAGDGKPNWSAIGNEINRLNGHGKRTGKQCRERWYNHLRPDIKKGGWTKEEEAMIQYYYEMFGPKWSAMAQVMKGRTDNDIKNKWNSMIRSAKIKAKKNPNDVIVAMMKAAKSKAPVAAPFASRAFVNQASISSSSEDSDNSAYSHQYGVQPDQAKVLYAANSLPQYSHEAASNLQQGGIAPMVTDMDNADKQFDVSWDDLDFSM